MHFNHDNGETKNFEKFYHCKYTHRSSNSESPRGRDDHKHSSRLLNLLLKHPSGSANVQLLNIRATAEQIDENSEKDTDFLNLFIILAK